MRIILVVFVCGLSGCATLAAQSVGHVGCREDEITTSDVTYNLGLATWTATCQGKAYVCSQQWVSGNETETACSPR